MLEKAKDLDDVFNLFWPVPLTKDERDFYENLTAVRTGRSIEHHYSIFERIMKSKKRVNIFVIGHIGCGKTTELNMLQGMFELNSVPSFMIEAKNLDKNNFGFFDIILCIAEKILDYVGKNKIGIDSSVIKKFYESLYTQELSDIMQTSTKLDMYTETSLGTPNLLKSLLSFVAKLNAGLRLTTESGKKLRRTIEPSTQSVVQALNDLLNVVYKIEKKTPVIVIDDLEKCKQENVQKLLEDTLSSLTDMDAHFVMGIPRSADISLFQSSILEMIPLVKTHDMSTERLPNQKGINKIIELILRRAEEKLFEEEVLNEIIQKCGGNLRYTMQMVSESAFQAMLQGRETIDLATAKRALREFRNDIFDRVQSKYFRLVRELYDAPQRGKQDNERADLLYSGALFEYNGENGDRWVDLHPLLVDYLKDNPKVLDYARAT